MWFVSYNSKKYKCKIKKICVHYLCYILHVCWLHGVWDTGVHMNQHANLWPLIGVHSRVLAEVLDTAERWLVQGESQKSGKFFFYPILPLSADYSLIM